MTLSQVVKPLLRKLLPLLGVAWLPAQGESLLWMQSGQNPAEHFGAAIALLGDMDGDGRAELAVGSFNASPLGSGAVSLLRGSDGAVLWRVSPGVPLTYFGNGMANLGDVDGDGYDDLLVGAPYDATSSPGYVYLLSGLTGQIVWSRAGLSVVPPGVFIQLFGLEIYAVGDVNGDGYGDAWVGAGDLTGAYGTVLSGRDGAVLRIHNRFNSRGHPYGACAIGDRDGDGFDDYVFGSPDDGAYVAGVSQYFGSVTLTSGRTGAPLLIIEGEHVPIGSGWIPGFGTSFCAFGDMDGDGVTDLAVGDPFWGYGTTPDVGRVQIVSGADGQPLVTFGSLATTRMFGQQVVSLGDVTGDGHGDFGTLGKMLHNGLMISGLHVVDGQSGQLIQTVWQDLLINLTWGGDFAGIAAGGMDLDGDRIPDVLDGVEGSYPYWGAPPNDHGLVFALDLGFSGVRPLARTRGVGCVTSLGTLPQMRIEGPPKLGLSMSLVGRALPAQAATLLLFGPPQVLDLAAFGAPGCTGYVDPGYLMAGTTNLGGYLRQEFALPAAPVLQGIALSAQWLALDAAANSLGMVLTNVADLELQP